MPINPPSVGGAGGGGSVTVYEEGAAVGTATLLNFVGAGATATFSGGTVVVTIPGGTTTAEIIVQDEGSTIGTASVLNFTGSGGTASYSGGTATINITGGDSIGTFPTLEQQVNFATATGGTATVNLGTVPSTGDVIFIAAAHVASAGTACSGAGATWVRVQQEAIMSGSFTTIDLWMGIVGGTPGTAITFNWQSSNTYYIGAAVYSGLSGFIEDSARWSSMYTPATLVSVQPWVPPKTPRKSPLAITASFMRGQGSPVIAGGFTNITTASAGGDRAFLSYLDTSSGTVTAGATWTGATGSQPMCVVQALIW